MELNDTERMRTHGTRLQKVCRDGAEATFADTLIEVRYVLGSPSGCWPRRLLTYCVFMQALSEMELDVEYKTARQNTIVRTSSTQVLLHAADGAKPVTIDVSSHDVTQVVMRRAQDAGAGLPPEDDTAIYNVRLTVTTPSLTNAGRKAGKFTTETDVLIEVHPEWAPVGAARFRMLVENQLFVGSRFHCVIPDFIVQFGMHADPHVGLQWSMPIMDDPPLQPNVQGTLAFVSTGPHTRCCALFANLGDNSKPGKWSQ
jgi:hypothetical protein